MPPLDDAAAAALEDDINKGSLVGDDLDNAKTQLAEFKDKEAGKDDDKVDDDDVKAAKGDDDKKEEKDDELSKAQKADEDSKAKKEVDEKDDDDAKKAADADDEAKAAKDKGIKVPKFRLDAATAARRKAEEEADRLRKELEEARAASQKADADKGKQSLEETRDSKLADIDKRMAAAVKDGDSDAIPGLMAESRAVERDYTEAKFSQNLEETRAATTTEVQESAQVNFILDQLESQYPEFDDSSDKYNQEMNDEVAKLQTAFIKDGKTQSEALLEAINYVLPRYGYSMEETDEKADTKTEKENDDKSDKKETKDRKKEVERNVDTAKKQPPDMDGAGDDSDKAGITGELPDAQDLTEAEFDALPDDTKKRMRGDYF